MKIEKNLVEVRKNIDTADLVAVTKTVGLKEVLKLNELGVNKFGESRVKDAQEKVRNVNAEWHLVGHLQSNKVKLAVELFDVIQSVDTIKLASLIDEECKKQEKVMPILLEINIAEEPQKYGFKVDEVENALLEISKLENVKIVGFMMMAPLVAHGMTRPFFRGMKALYDKHKQQYNLIWLSMGMTNDYKIAIEEGSNMVRIGRALFD
ncbi:YggS family pyridoxal phosphate-dependent enzyme [Candidatus Woesearchaeota archaeon]|nr:YggS family pyridoxal phosphate-dependent enzyme [Candidatus Woesearchaeota archaeon]